MSNRLLSYAPQVYDVLHSHTGGVLSVAWGPSDTLASTSTDTTVCVWNAMNGALLHTLRGHMGDVAFVAWKPDGHTLASAGKDRTVRLWDARDGAALHVLKGHTGDVSCVTFDASGHTLASVSADRTLRYGISPTAAPRARLSIQVA